MVDPLAEVVTLLQPRAPFSKVVSGAGRWRVRRAGSGQPFYCVLLDGACRLEVDGRAPVDLVQGDFVLIASVSGFTMSSMTPPTASDADTTPVALLHGEFRLGAQGEPPDVLLLVGHCVFGSPDAALLVSLLPQLVHVRGEPRLATIVQLVADESRAQRAARDVILARLLEVLLIESLRCSAGTAASPGLLRGLADERLAPALRRIHENMKHPWTVAQLAKEAALSRSAFFERFSRALGMAPMAYLLAWRMALAKDLLRRQEGGVADVAERVGYASASAFSVAFTRHVGLPPARYARGQAAS
ncbi:AraC family transcriptional regulator [Massilia antarctica]|uniref:AraC family transcriptional regulator n=1 Tax=Massilia antarctica TaxID=2765360 RepID=UPI0006BB9677|nr:AraC family transcriptional regulator [Massilia sp. H27-R4]MCY0915276.1 AraC family transcriptional regulator [Massilia sp. H27-R4]CUI05666.1 Transcriptional regulator, AraC family [Janthinobacterium sp. CG23_2]CUU29452.1 Transcriptional regulator, AraC family [Janthinobacterium sp. CG23_2]